MKAVHKPRGSKKKVVARRNLTEEQKKKAQQHVAKLKKVLENKSVYKRDKEGMTYLGNGNFTVKKKYE